ncbi:hypothetical protein BDF14DRAFT_1735851 [Spinellus fusiger]|nr:hypothetical protein BDF14DRAFT_1735851 [Spinellus fusiger]
MYDLLAARGKAEETTDPDVQRYQKAKALFLQGYDLCMTIPRTLEDDVLEKYEEDVKKAAETMISAWIMDEKAAPMSERVLILGQQYEKVLLRPIPKDQQEGFYIKESLFFSAWILLVGKQYQHCISTLTIAIDSYDDVPACIYYIRASCQLSLGKLRLGVKDLEVSLQKDPSFVMAYSILGTVYMSLKERENAIRNYKLFIQHSHPDSTNYFTALYSLAIVLHQKGKKTESHDYYVKGKAAEARFEYLYGQASGTSNIKREAIQIHETPEVARKLIKQEEAPPMQYNAKIEQLIQSGFLTPSFSPSPKQCSQCGSSHRKEDKDKPLMCCGGCKSIWYCSRECQVNDYKRHKVECQKSKKAEPKAEDKAQTA